MYRYAPTDEWHICTVLDLLRTAGGYIRDDQVSSIISLFASHPEQHPVIAAKLYRVVREDASLVSSCGYEALPVFKCTLFL